MSDKVLEDDAKSKKEVRRLLYPLLYAIAVLTRTLNRLTGFQATAVAKASQRFEGLIESGTQKRNELLLQLAEFFNLHEASLVEGGTSKVEVRGYVLEAKEAAAALSILDEQKLEAWLHANNLYYFVYEAQKPKLNKDALKKVLAQRTDLKLPEAAGVVEKTRTLYLTPPELRRGNKRYKTPKQSVVLGKRRTA